MDKQFFNLIELKSGLILNDQQREAILHVSGPALVLAAPGSGKTTMLLCRTANLVINRGVNPSAILTLTFNRAAVRDMEERYKKLFYWIDVKINFSTIHAFALKIIKSKIEGRLNIIEGDNTAVNKTSILKKLYYEFNREYLAEDKLDELSRSITYVKNMMIKNNDINKLKCKIDNFEEIYIRYEEIKKSHGYIDFDDMLTIAYDILRNNPEKLKNHKTQFSYIQIDEFQDNSKIQNEIIKLLAAPENNLFTVADDDQSIYGFRGAYPEGVLKFGEDFNGAKVFLMEQNYRSTSSIVDTAYEFIKTNKARYGKSIFTKNEVGKTIEIIDFKDEAEQSKFITDKIKHETNLSENAILFRNNISSVIVADEFYSQNILFYMKDSNINFFKHWVVQDIIAFIKLSLDGSDIDSFKKIYYKCGLYIQKQAANYAFEKYSSGSVLKTLKACPILNGFQIGKIIGFEQSLRRLSYFNPIEAIHFIEKEIGYKAYLNENGTKKGYSLDSIEAVMDSLKFIAGKTKTIIEFLSRLLSLSDIIEDSKNNKGKNAVTLSTLHSAKGLEFQKVYIIDLIDGTFPGKSSIEDFEKGDATAIEEERRLCYVGITRAKKELNLCTACSRNGSRVFFSRFVGEIYSILSPVDQESIT